MFLISYIALNNDFDYRAREFCFKIKKLPNDIKQVVKDRYDGVNEPQLDSIEVFHLRKLDGLL